MFYKSTRNANGFTLLEMAIVLMISGLVLGMSLSVLRPILTSQYSAVTKQKIDRVLNALSTYALQKNALPCPGLPDAVSPDMPGKAPTSCASGDSVAVWGIVPYTTLGLTQPDVIDGFGHYMTYVVPKALTVAVGNASTDGQQTAKFKGNVASNFCGNPRLLEEDILFIHRPDQNIVEPKIAVAIISYGNDGIGAYDLESPDPKRRSCPVGIADCKMPADEKCNETPGLPDNDPEHPSHERDNAVNHASCHNNNTIYVTASSSQAGLHHFDDQIAYSTGSALISRLNMAGCSQ